MGLPLRELTARRGFWRLYSALSEDLRGHQKEHNRDHPVAKYDRRIRCVEDETMDTSFAVMNRSYAVILE